jgi:hypothetical protein
MSTKTIIPTTPRLPVPRAKTLWCTAPANLQERLECIEALSCRITGYVQFMCEAGNSSGASVDAREKAVRAFYEQMVAMDRQLGRIQEEFQLE